MDLAKRHSYILFKNLKSFLAKVYVREEKASHSFTRISLSHVWPYGRLAAQTKRTIVYTKQIREGFHTEIEHYYYTIMCDYCETQRCCSCIQFNLLNPLYIDVCVLNTQSGIQRDSISLYVTTIFKRRTLPESVFICCFFQQNIYKRVAQRLHIAISLMDREAT